jgi:hypothetical protein
MKIMRLWLVAFIGSGIFFACGLEIEDPYDADAVRAADIQAINDLIEEKGWPEPDTTESGARYFIIKKSAANDTTIKQLDVVYFDYTGFTLGGNVFVTTVQDVADTVYTSTDGYVFEPIPYTYTETGWSLRYINLVYQYLSGLTASTALMEAITVSFGQMTEGDRVTILLPSYEAATTASLANTSPIYYEIEVAQVIPAEE